jgi:hypothetical protein
MARLPPLRVTTPAINLIQHLGGAVHQEMLGIERPAYEAAGNAGLGRNIVKYVQQRLGPQTRTWTGEFRSYLWERPTYTLWVANRKGIAVEVVPDLAPGEVLDTYREAFSLLGPV